MADSDKRSAPYFRECISAADLDELNIEIIRNTLYKAYLADFHRFTTSIGGATAEVMHDLLSFEADRRTLNITVNSFGTDLSKQQRSNLFPQLGRLYPEHTLALSRADDIDQVKTVTDTILDYRHFLASNPGARVASNARGQDFDTHDTESAAADLEDHFFKMEVHLNRESVMRQFQYGTFYSYFKLREQEIRNLTSVIASFVQLNFRHSLLLAGSRNV